MLFGGTGFFIDRFQATQFEGVVWLHGNLAFNRFTGPGRVGIQSACVHLPTEN